MAAAEQLHTKSDRGPRQPIPDIIWSRPVKTVPISPLMLQTAYPPTPPPTELVHQGTQSVHHAAPKPKPTDICRRHGGYRQDYGKRWRCVYPGRK